MEDGGTNNGSAKGIINAFCLINQLGAEMMEYGAHGEPMTDRELHVYEGIMYAHDCLYGLIARCVGAKVVE